MYHIIHIGKLQLMLYGTTISDLKANNALPSFTSQAIKKYL